MFINSFIDHYCDFNLFGIWFDFKFDSCYRFCFPCYKFFSSGCFSSVDLNSESFASLCALTT